MIIMIVVYYYIVYVVFCGVFLCIRYLAVEKRIVRSDEFILLFLIAPFGYGNWHYNRIIRLNKTSEFSRKRFVWKKMIPINLGFIVFYIFSLIRIVIESELHPEADIILIWFSYSSMIIGGIIMLMILYLVFISLPKYMVRLIDKKQNLIIKEIPETYKFKEIQDPSLRWVDKPSNKGGIDFLTRVTIQFIGSLIIGFVFAYYIYDIITPDSVKFDDSLVELIIGGVCFSIVFIFSFIIIWLLFYFFNKSRKSIYK